VVISKPRPERCIDAVGAERIQDRARAAGPVKETAIILMQAAFGSE
jgi:hypothetical protein